MLISKTQSLYYKLFFIITILLFSSAAIYSQTDTIASRWIWKQAARQNKPQIQFTIQFTRNRDVIHGTYSVDEYINGKWQGEDGNQTPFIGLIKDSTIEIEFDPSATVAGYEENVTYRAPSDGRKPSTARLSADGKALIWHRVNPPGIEGVPSKFKLKRE